MNKEEPIGKGALWQKISKTGSKYYKGQITIDGVSYWATMFPNTIKKSENTPDFSILIDKKEEKPKQADPSELTEDDYAMFGNQHQEEDTEDGLELPF